MLLTFVERPTRLSPNGSLLPWQKKRSYEVSFFHSFHSTVFTAHASFRPTGRTSKSWLYKWKIAVRSPSPSGPRRAPGNLRRHRATRPRRSHRQSSGCIRPYRQANRRRSALGSFETISVNTVSDRSLRFAPSIAFSTVTQRR